MEKVVRKLVLIALLLRPIVFASDIVATGAWSTTLSSADLTSGAGSDLPNTVASATSVTTVTVTNTLTSVIYHVYARVNNSTWPPGVVLWVKRTSNGSSLLPLATIAGGSSYQALGSTDVEIFSGLLDRSNIALQFQLVGLSVSVAPSTYLTNVIFTIGP